MNNSRTFDPVNGFVAKLKGHTLAGDNAEFTYAGRLQTEDLECPEFRAVITFKDESSGISVRRSVSIQSSELYDLLNLSLCLFTIAEREHTVESIPDLELGSEYFHNVETMMFQYLHELCFVQLFAKRTGAGLGQRILWFFFRDELDYVRLTWFDMLATPETIRSFASALRKLFEYLIDLEMAISSAESGEKG